MSSLPDKATSFPTPLRDTSSVVVRRTSRTIKPSLRATEAQMTKAKELSQRIWKIINQQISEHSTYETELSSNQINDVRKAEIEAVLLRNRSKLNALYDMLRTFSVTLDDEIRLSVDRLDRDRSLLLNSLTNKPVTTSQSVSNHANDNQRAHTLSSVSGSSASRSTTSSKLAARRAELEAKIQQDAVDAEVLKLRLELAEKELQLSKKKHQVDKELLEQLKRIDEEDAISQQHNGSRLMLNTGRSPLLKETSVQSSPPNEIAKQTLEAISQSLELQQIPADEPDVFQGDHLEFREWWQSFEDVVGQRNISNSRKLRLLKKYTDGKPKAAISSCLEYGEAVKMLKARFGHERDIVAAYRKKLYNWPKIHGKDKAGLRAFADFLKHCLVAIGTLPKLTVLNDDLENDKLLEKLPDGISSRWAKLIVDTEDSKGHYPTFEEFVRFITREADAANRLPDSGMVKEVTKRVRNFQISRDSGTMQPSVPKGKCLKCGRENHQTAECFQLTKLPYADRKRFVQERKLCYGCLDAGHFISSCPKPRKCKMCAEEHPTALHGEQSSLEEHTDHDTQQDTAVTAQSHRTSSKSEQQSRKTSMTLPVWVSHSSQPKKETLVYAMLDTQSDTSFITNNVAKKLGLAGQPITMNLSTMTSTERFNTCKFINVKVRGYNSDVRFALPPLYARDEIPAPTLHIPTAEIAKQWPHLEPIACDIPDLLDVPVGLLLGYDCSQAFLPRECRYSEPTEPFGVRTDLGWSILGTSGSDHQETGTTHRIATRTDDTLYDESASCEVGSEFKPKCNETPSIEVLSKLEHDFQKDLESDMKLSQDDLKFMKIMKNTYQDEQGFYTMPLPFKRRPIMPDNRATAMRRFRLLEKKLSKNPRDKEDYHNFMQKMIENGDAECANDEPVPGEVWYLPHFCVRHPKKDKLRVVFDASCQYEGYSINSYLLEGPEHINNLLGILCRFRLHSIGIMGDIEQMFHRFKVAVSDRNYFRFLWYDRDDPSNVSDYRMTVHLFGATSSPGCATHGLRTIAADHQMEYPHVADFINENFYVDDGIVSVQTVEEAVRLVQDTRDVCDKGRVHLHKFISNSRELMSTIPKSEQAPALQRLDLDHDALPVDRALGIQWCAETDKFQYNIMLNSKPNTRRGVLSTVASVYDPIGVVAPYILLGKQILQDTCKKLQWDDQLPSSLLERWENWKMQLVELKDISVDRCLKPADFGPTSKTELHHFCDASNDGYGACTYVRFVNTEGEIHCSFVLGKSKVAPTKRQTIPRLELQAAVTATELSTFLKSELSDLNVDQEHFWSDSQAVLGYINNESRRFHVFVANRVQTIQNRSDANQWHYIKSDNNPADIASRGMSPKALKNSAWIKAPDFLWEKDVISSLKKVQDRDYELDMTDREVKQAHNLKTSATFCYDLIIDLLMPRLSNWRKLTRIVARLKNAIHNKSLLKMKDEPTNQQIKDAERYVLLKDQQRSFTHESPERALKNLSPITEDGLLRVGGRLDMAAALSWDEQHPIILHKDSLVADMIIRYFHEKTHHQGRCITLAAVRQAGYWAVNGPSKVARLISRCVVCAKIRKSPETQKMASLPKHRVEQTAPFTHVGIDCFGPFLVQDKRREIKHYGLMVTCLYSRAIHLEVLPDMSADSFINALRCVIGIRGPIQTIRCDRGTNFIGAFNELKKIVSITPKSRLGNPEIIFNPPHASHWGGVWERQIRTARSVLNGILQNQKHKPDYLSLRALFYETMAIVNSRPLSTEDLNDPHSAILTPNHLLTMKSDFITCPPGDIDKADAYSRKRWRRVQQLANEFWKKWRAQYLQSLQTRKKWQQARPNVKVGDVVLINDSSMARADWPIGRVVGTSKGTDNLTRAVEIKKADRSIILRPISKIVVLLTE